VVEHSDVAPQILARLRQICAELPEVREERAWVGTRWRVRSNTFAHVLAVEGGNPPGYARVAGTDGPITLLMFRSSGEELAALHGAGHPFLGPPWRRDEIGMVIDDAIDWDEVRELITDSYCLRAPKKLADQVDRP
jgi:predicted DNA-binding protein (MmcQ/YjbR family)